jgi:hypothetical protein
MPDTKVPATMPRDDDIKSDLLSEDIVRGPRQNVAPRAIGMAIMAPAAAPDRNTWKVRMVLEYF